jgi:nicotinamidase-related amidase
MNKRALIVIDLVHDFTHPKGRVYDPANEAIIENVQKLLDAMRQTESLIIFMKHTYRKDKYDKNRSNMRPCCIEGSGGETIDERLSIDEKKDYVLKKRRYSAFYGTDLDLILREHKIEDVVLVGTKTNNCIFATALDAHYRDYRVKVILDCVATSDPIKQEIYLDDINRYIGSVLSLQEYLES